MEFYQLIRQRESVRDYDPERKVRREIIERILEAGRLAPSAANRQPWTFIVVSTPEILNKVKTCYHRDWFKNAPHILIVAGRKEESWVRSYDSYNAIETDLTIAMDHMILAAENEGIGTCWIAAFNPALLRDALQLEDDEVVFAITPLGYQSTGYVKKSVKTRKELKDIVLYL
ncbi:MAG: nitroreductase family protein [Bacteroidales bacterium]|nr:nitroreductase family protein [Bacteroidales bacterium]